VLNFKAEKNLVTIYQIQILHQETLIFELLLPAIESQNSEYDDVLSEEFNSIMINWGKQELYNYCFISTYHLWEKQIGHIIRDQSKGDISSPSRDFVMSVKKILEEKFEIKSIDENCWKTLDQARTIVNAFKHGEGTSLKALRNICPEIIFEEECDTHHSVLEIQRKHLEELIKNLKDFYENLEKETELDFRNWLSPTKS